MAQENAGGGKNRVGGQCLAKPNNHDVSHLTPFIVCTLPPYKGCHPERSRRAPIPTKMPRDPRTYCTYIIGSLSGTLYIGITGNLHKRVFEHKFHRIEGFTEKYDVERLLCWESFDQVGRAIAREKQLKGWRRSKKIALIESVNPHWLDLAQDWFPWMTNSVQIKMSS